MIKEECMNLREYGFYTSAVGVQSGKEGKHMGRENESYITFSDR